jgi:hypothetical protein
MIEIYKQIIILILLVIFSGLVYGLVNTSNNIKSNKVLLLKLENEKLKKDIETISNDSNKTIILQHSPNSINSDDLITLFDHKSLNDPLYESTKRPPRHVIRPIIGNPHFNYPTRGYYDSFSLMGYLINNNQQTTDNKILKLFGREKYPNSSQNEYYVIINNGYNDQIKYSLENYTKELYNKDSVYVDILKSNYTVNLLKNKSFEYNPHLF